MNCILQHSATFFQRFDHGTTLKIKHKMLHLNITFDRYASNRHCNALHFGNKYPHLQKWNYPIKSQHPSSIWYGWKHIILSQLSSSFPLLFLYVLFGLSLSSPAPHPKSFSMLFSSAFRTCPNHCNAIAIIQLKQSDQAFPSSLGGVFSVL